MSRAITSGRASPPPPSVSAGAVDSAALDYIEQRAGTEFDPEIARAFAIMMRRVEVRPTPFEDLSAEPNRLAQGAQ